MIINVRSQPRKNPLSFYKRVNWLVN